MAHPRLFSSASIAANPLAWAPSGSARTVRHRVREGAPSLRERGTPPPGANAERSRGESAGLLVRQHAHLTHWCSGIAAQQDPNVGYILTPLSFSLMVRWESPSICLRFASPRGRSIPRPARDGRRGPESRSCAMPCRMRKLRLNICQSSDSNPLRNESPVTIFRRTDQSY